MSEVFRYLRRSPAQPCWTVIVALLFGCSEAGSQQAARHANPLATDPNFRQEVFDHAIDNLHRLEQFQPHAMLDQIRQQLNEAVDWNRDVDWQRDPLVDSLPPEILENELLRSAEDLKLNVYDASHLQETVTLQGISRSAVGGATSDLERAHLLFDWVIRNVQFPLSNDVQTSNGQVLRAPHLPMETLFFGRGDSIDRAWVFVLLCRQQGLDAVVLALPGNTPNDPVRPWVVGVLIDDQIYLFDPTLGLPVPGPNGEGIATLRQAIDDESILQQLNLDADHRYPVSPSELDAVTALIEASPAYLTRRMRVLEGKLAGEDKIVLAESPSRIAKRISKIPQIAAARLWGLPYDRFMQRVSPHSRDATVAALQAELLPYRVDLLPADYQPAASNLQRGRLLHLKGILAAEEGEPSANRFYQDARLADVDIEVPALNDTQRRILRRAKEDASYWLGLVAFERGRFEAALSHLQKRSLSSDNSGRWAAGAHYNSGRAFEALGKFEDAIAEYKRSDDPQLHGNLLRARSLAAKLTNNDDTIPAEPQAVNSPD